MAQAGTIKLFGSKADAHQHGFGIGSKVVRRNQLPAQFSTPEQVMEAVASAKEGIIEDHLDGDYYRVTFDGNGGTGRYHVNHLVFLAPPHSPYQKKLKWHGNTVGELRQFMVQLEREGVSDDVEFLNIGAQHLHITVPLPLATDDGDYEEVTDDTGKVIKRIRVGSLPPEHRDQEWDNQTEVGPSYPPHGPGMVG